MCWVAFLHVAVAFWFRDRTVRWARTWEANMVVIVIALMVVKPF